eukprot:5052329-Prymnesium_polylepis.3
MLHQKCLEPIRHQDGDQAVRRGKDGGRSRLPGFPDRALADDGPKWHWLALAHPHDRVQPARDDHRAPVGCLASCDDLFALIEEQARHVVRQHLDFLPRESVEHLRDCLHFEQLGGSLFHRQLRLDHHDVLA